MVSVQAEKSNAQIGCIHTRKLTSLTFDTGPGMSGFISGTTRRTLMFWDPKLALKEGRDVLKARTYQCNTLSALMEKQSMVGWQQAFENMPGRSGPTSQSEG